MRSQRKGEGSAQARSLSFLTHAPLFGPTAGATSIKDPTAIRHEGAWHLFATVRAKHPTHRIEYLRFDDFPPQRIERTFLELGAPRVAAPQVFLHRPSARFFLIFQLPDGPAYSTNASLDPNGWTPARRIEVPPLVKPWLDFWAIASGERMHLFFTSLDGRMWRAETSNDDFPNGFGEPVLALEADLFEASHLYDAGPFFLCIVEAKRLVRRHQRWFAAKRLDGPWTSLGVFASRPGGSISHGELLRAGIDERMQIDPSRARFLFQYANDLQTLLPYPRIPWRIGMLESLGPIAVDQIVELLR